LAPGDVASVFGHQFIAGALVEAPSVPLPVQLGGARVLVNDRPAPLYFASFGQISFQIPYETAGGPAEIRVERDGQRGNAVSVDIAGRATRILIVVNQDGSLNGGFGRQAVRPARIGDVLTIYATGLGRTFPVATTGAAAPAAEPFNRVDPTPTVRFGGGFIGNETVGDVIFAGLTPGLVGLYQVNVIIPDGTLSGRNVPTHIEVDRVLSNIVQVRIE
ncbi:MAG: hypothetical protein ACRD96_05640, partial [Bryobacteraceae bacterium]